MIVAAWVVVLLLLTLFFNKWLETEQNPNRTPQSLTTPAGAVEIRLQRNSSGHYVFDGEINGHPVTFFVDTGASDVTVPGRLAEKLGLHRGLPYQADTANGRITVFATRIQRLRMGDIVLRNVRASINPYMDGDEILLGMSALKQVELEQKDGTLVIRQR